MAGGEKIHINPRASCKSHSQSAVVRTVVQLLNRLCSVVYMTGID